MQAEFCVKCADDAERKVLVERCCIRIRRCCGARSALATRRIIAHTVAKIWCAMSQKMNQWRIRSKHMFLLNRYIRPLSFQHGRNLLSQEAPDFLTGEYSQVVHNAMNFPECFAVAESYFNTAMRSSMLMVLHSSFTWCEGCV